MLAAIICERFGWTWQEFYDQPVHFIRAIVCMLEHETEARKRESKKSSS